MLLYVTYTSKEVPVREHRACARIEGDQGDASMVYRYFRALVQYSIPSYHFGIWVPDVREVTGMSLANDSGQSVDETYSKSSLAMIRSI